MHELSIALSVLEIVQEQADRRGASGVAAVHLKLGPLSGVVPAALVSAYNLAREGTPFENCEMVIEETPIIGYCPKCRTGQPVKSIQELCCFACGTPTPDILSGRELEISAMEITENTDEQTNAAC